MIRVTHSKRLLHQAARDALAHRLQHFCNWMHTADVMPSPANGKRSLRQTGLGNMWTDVNSASRGLTRRLRDRPTREELEAEEYVSDLSINEIIAWAMSDPDLTAEKRSATRWALSKAALLCDFAKLHEHRTSSPKTSHKLRILEP